MPTTLDNLNQLVQSVKGVPLGSDLPPELEAVYDAVAEDMDGRGATLDALVKEMEAAALSAGVEGGITRGTVSSLSKRKGGQERLPVLRAWMKWRAERPAKIDLDLARQAYAMLGAALGLNPISAKQGVAIGAHFGGKKPAKKTGTD